MTLAAGLANRLWFGLNVPGYRAYRKALGDPRRTQERLLKDYLRTNAETLYGRRHRFGEVRSFADYQARVPLSTYDDYAPYVARIARGEAACLTRAPVRFLAPTSGSTAAAKLIPYTAPLQAEFRRAVAPWAFDLMRRRPAVRGGPAYWSISPALDLPANRDSAVPIGFEEDSAILGGLVKPLVDATLAVPAMVARISDIALFRDITLLHLLRAPDLRILSVWHPSFLSFLLGSLEAAWDGLLEDLARGLRLDEPGIAIPPDPARARALETADPCRPERIWPRLALISCWGDAHAAGELDEIGRLFPGVEVQTKGLIATEAFVSLPFEDDKPLAVTSHVFEFLDDDGRAYPAWRVKEGGVYSVVVTTGGGLYRYRLQDRVEITGFLDQTPCVRFLGKEDRLSDLYGEKLSEGFVADVLRETFARAGVTARFALLAPDDGNGSGRYLLFLDAADGPPPGLAAELEAALRRNPHYDYCVRLGQLAPMRIVRVGADAYARYTARLSARGQRLGDIKPAALSPLSGWRAVFEDAGP